MLDYLYQTTDVQLFLILCGIIFAISAVALVGIRLCLPLHLRYQENSVIGFTSAMIIGIYGVLAGFATLYLINNNNSATDSVQKEANAVANLYRNSDVLPDPLRGNVQAQIKDYINQVLKVEWPLMEAGKIVPDTGDGILEKIVKDVGHSSANPVETSVLAQMLSTTKDLYNARQYRIQMSYASLSPEIWVVILIGSMLTLVISYLFGINFYLHFFVVMAATLMTTSIIFLLISLDKPFQGEYVVGPDILKGVAKFVEEQQKPN